MITLRFRGGLLPLPSVTELSAGVSYWSELLLIVSALLAVVCAVTTAALVAASWPPLTASVEPTATLPAATLWSATGALVSAPTSVASLDCVPPLATVGALLLE